MFRMPFTLPWINLVGLRQPLTVPESVLRNEPSQKRGHTHLTSSRESCVLTPSGLLMSSDWLPRRWPNKSPTPSQESEVTIATTSETFKVNFNTESPELFFFLAKF